jgi:hypothetical protein
VVQTGPISGGNLPAPALILPTNYTILRGNTARVTFQWTRVNGAARYRLRRITQSGQTDLSVLQPASGSKVQQEVPFSFESQFSWTVTPVSATETLGEVSTPGAMIFTKLKAATWDLDQSGTPSPNDLFGFTKNWTAGFTVSDLDQDGLTNSQDAGLLITSQQLGALPTPEPVPGFIAPTIITPASSSHAISGDVQFIWQPLIGAVGYEMNLFQDLSATLPTTTLVIPQPASGNASVTLSLFPRESSYRWRVRATFASGANGPYSPEIPFQVE